MASPWRYGEGFMGTRNKFFNGSVSVAAFYVGVHFLGFNRAKMVTALDSIQRFLYLCEIGLTFGQFGLTFRQFGAR